MLEQQFETAIHGIIREAENLTPPVKFTRLKQMVNTHGGKAAADRILANPKIGDGFTNLFMSGKENLNLSIEYLVLQEPWKQLFTAEQLQIAEKRLAEFI